MSPKPVTYKGLLLPGLEMDWAQFQAGRDLWSDEKFLRSSDVESLRHYTVNAVIPICIEELGQISPASGGAFHFRDLPVLGSRVVFPGFYLVMDDALRAISENVHGMEKFKKVDALMAASLSFPIRIHMNHTSSQVGLDSITYTEDLFAVGVCNSVSFLDSVVKVVHIFEDRWPAFVMITKGQTAMSQTFWLTIEVRCSINSFTIGLSRQNVWTSRAWQCIGYVCRFPHPRST